MAVNIISSSDSVTYLSPSETQKQAGLTVDNETFLALLVAQLQYQDPLDPQTDTEFVAQLAQMSSLEQMQQLNTTVSNTSAYDMIGKYVYAEILDDQTGVTTGYYGYAESVVIRDGEQYVVSNGYAIPVSEISQVLDSDVFASADDQTEESAL